MPSCGRMPDGAPSAQSEYRPSGLPKGTGRGIAAVGENRHARSSAKACDSSSFTGTPRTSPT